MLLTGSQQFKQVRVIGGIFLVSGLVALAVAYGSEHFLYLTPCELCLWERMPWRVLVALGILSLVLSPRFARWPVLAGLVCLLISLGLSVLHVGVEHGWWPSPAAQCHAVVTHGGSADDWLGKLPARPVKPCDFPDYILGLPVSMTALAGLYSLIVLVVALAGTVRIFRHVHHGRQNHGDIVENRSERML